MCLCISKAFSPICEKLQSDKNCADCAGLLSKLCQSSFILMTVNQVGHIFLFSSIVFPKVLPITLCYSFGTTLQSIDSVYFQALYCIRELFSSTNYSVQNQQRKLYLMGCTMHLISFESHMASESGTTFKYIFLCLWGIFIYFKEKVFFYLFGLIPKVSFLLFKG